MSGAYQLIALAQAQPGMVLSDVLLDRHGQVLLAKGAVLSDTAIRSLARHGVTMLRVVGAEPQPPADPAQIQARLDHLFRRNRRDDNEDWASGLLRRYVEDYRLGREVKP